MVEGLRSWAGSGWCLIDADWMVDAKSTAGLDMVGAGVRMTERDAINQSSRSAIMRPARDGVTIAGLCGSWVSIWMMLETKAWIWNSGRQWATLMQEP